MFAKLPLKDTILHYVEEGTGDAFVFVHGSAASMVHGQYLAKHLAGGNRFISYSQRFHLPNNPAAPGAYTADQHAEDLLELLEQLNISHCNILGHSYGCQVVLTAAIRQPEKFKKLYLAEPALAFLINGKEEYKELMEERNDTFQRIKNCFDEGRSADAVATLMRYANGARGFIAFPEEIRWDMAANAAALFRQVYETQQATLNADLLATLQVPTTVLLGSQCTNMYRCVAEEMKKLLPDIIIKSIDNCAHDLIYLKADAISKLL